ncbi:hypothetical protein CYJ73_11620 [Gordonia terrae]|uniref:Pyrrolo-quinoline quinone repeat domain-containing protein n=1 Tax=Gordonia terrae TaxID=2055 RepID=A0A2I1R859_9ACTN|nr:PQQ-binding-like beta-propeller repeat protein [Gordonia terrae]PKZ65324.1 hypothetical protein CYJ73_11620 [Gordonia terrae]
MSNAGPPDDDATMPGSPDGDESPTTIQPARPTVVPGVSLNKGQAPDPYAATQTGPTPQYPPQYQQPPSACSPSPVQAQYGYPPPGYPPPGYPPPGYPQPGYPHPGYRRRSNRRAYLITGVALVCVLALVLGGVVWWKVSLSDGGSDDTPGLVAGQLTGSFPTVPSPAWSVDASSLGGMSFLSPQGSEGQYGSPGGVSDGEVLVSIVGEQFSSVGNAYAVGIDARTGAAWRFDEPVRSCADTIVDHRIACVGNGKVHFLDTRTGDAIATVAAPAQSSEIAFNGAAAFMTQYAADDSVVFHKITESGTEWSRVLTGLPEPALGSGDASQFTATDEVVASANLRTLVVSADDGRSIIASAGTSEIGRFEDGSVALETGTVRGLAMSDRRVTVVDPDGATTDFPGESAIVPSVATPGQRGRFLLDGQYVDSDDGASMWPTVLTDIDQFGSRIVLADDREIVLFDRGAGEYMALDPTSGEQLWRSSSGSSSTYSGHAVTDGEHLIAPTADGGVSALDLVSGSPVWSLPSTAIGNVPGADGADPRPALTFAVGDRLLTMTATTITGFAPTGPAAIVPGSTRTADPTGGEGDPEYVTPCGAPPVFTPQSFRTSAGGLGITMKVTAKCPGGDVLYGPQTRITVTDGNGIVASGNFDFRRAPVAVPSLDAAGEALTLELTYPPGSFFRLPDTLGTQGATPGGADRYLVDCDKGPTPGSAPKLATPQAGSSASSTATSPSFPAGADVTASSVSALRLQADADRSFILANLNNRWVAQLSSKQPGLVAEGRTWTDQAILDEFLALRLRFNDVRLLWSDEWPVFSYRGWWVTVAAATFPGPVEANNWCRAQGFGPDNCFAKLVSTTAGPERTTLYWK